MATDQLAARYERIATQLADLYRKQDDPIARMATAAALLHHKQKHFFWTGFYRLIDGRLVVGPYQGPIACAVLDGPDGVCWACARGGESLVVPDVHAFPGHVACDSRANSEIVVPVRGRDGGLAAVLDVDSERPDAFSDVDRVGLERVAAMIYGD